MYEDIVNDDYGYVLYNEMLWVNTTINNFIISTTSFTVIIDAVIISDTQYKQAIINIVTFFTVYGIHGDLLFIIIYGTCKPISWIIIILLIILMVVVVVIKGKR